MAQAVAWSSRVMTISLEMVLPGMLGHWIDQKLGTVMLFLVLGVILGMTAGLIHLVRLGSATNRDASADQAGSDEPDDSKR